MECAMQVMNHAVILPSSGSDFLICQMINMRILSVSLLEWLTTSMFLVSGQGNQEHCNGFLIIETETKTANK